VSCGYYNCACLYDDDDCVDGNENELKKEDDSVAIAGANDDQTQLVAVDYATYITLPKTGPRLPAAKSSRGSGAAGIRSAPQFSPSTWAVAMPRKSHAGETTISE